MTELGTKESSSSTNDGEEWQLLTERRETLAEIMDENHEAWDSRVGELIQNGTRIIAVRGAGSVNGISQSEIQALVDKLASMIAPDDDATTAFIFDGDPDDRNNPDVGAVFGILADQCQSDPRISFLAAQRQSWYNPTIEGAPLTSAHGRPYETYIFPDKEDGISGGHSELTQSKTLANYANFRTVFVGPVGPIAIAQLNDLNEKVAGEPANVTIISTHNNTDLNAANQAKLDMARMIGNTEKAAKIEKMIEQRHSHPYGEFYDANGNLVLDTSGARYPNLHITLDEELLRK